MRRVEEAEDVGRLAHVATPPLETGRMFGRVYQSVMGLPVVYNHVRPFLLGGLDLSPFYSSLQVAADSVVLDVGCGTGNALDYLDEFESYVGFDTDPVAIGAARQRPDAQSQPVRFECSVCTRADVHEVDPTHAILAGVLHHLDDETALEVLQNLTNSPRFQRLCTLDIVLLPGLRHGASNVLARLDRGRHVRSEAGYRALIRRAGLDLHSERLLWNHPQRRIARYYTTVVCRKNP